MFEAMNRSQLLRTRTAAVDSITRALACLEVIAAEADAEPEVIESDVRRVLRDAFKRFEAISVEHFETARAAVRSSH
jgi:hypothetical protein